MLERRRSLGGSGGRRRARTGRRHVLEEIGHRHFEHARKLVQPARPDAVGAALILLHLLEGETERFAKLFLAHAK